MIVSKNKPKILTTKVQHNASFIEVFSEEEEPVFVTEDECSETQIPPCVLKIYPVVLKDINNKIYGNMCYSIDENHINILELEKTVESARYVGTALVEWLLLKSYELRQDGNIEITSAYGSYIFWYALGFRSRDEQENAAIKNRIAERQPELSEGRLPQKQEEGDLSFTFMYLPSESKALLLRQFRKSPDASLISSCPFFLHKKTQSGADTDHIKHIQVRTA